MTSALDLIPSGRHATTEVPFPDWVPSSVREAARHLSEEAAIAELAAWLG